jgi:hypothetical protein
MDAELAAREAGHHLFGMTPTKLFKNGNSQAVRIPAELAYKR